MNPVRVDVGGHPANSGFLVFVEGDIALNADESEGTVAAGGNLSFNATYNVAAHRPQVTTFTAPGDTSPTYLYVGGGMSWTGANILRVLNDGFTKIADSSTYTARNRDQNNAQVNYRIGRPGDGFDSVPRIEGTTSQQSPASVATPVPSTLIDISTAFARYRQLTDQLAQCAANAEITDPNGGSTPVPQPFAPGTRGRLTLSQGQTNVLTMTSQDLSRLSEITFVNQPGAATPLIVNVTGTAYAGDIPNLAGISGSQAPYILWNFPQAGTIVVTGGATIEGTLYAPNAALNWRPTQNIEGNVVAASFTHGPVAGRGAPREVHDFPFSTTVSCAAAPSTGTLTLVKHVDNAQGGSAAPSDWTLTATGPSQITGDGNSPAVTDQSVQSGDYQLSESDGPPNYAPGRWSCTGGTLTGRSVTVAGNADVTCEITNTYVAPPPPTGRLTLVKHMDNSAGGTDAADEWTLSATGPQTLTGTANSPDVTDVKVVTGNYLLSESGGPADYTAQPWSCTGGSLRADTVTVGAGADVTCEITNTYVPPPAPSGTLTLVKHVDNIGGGSATPDEWTLTADGPQTVSGAANSPQVTTVAVTAGDYVLTESGGPVDYTAGPWSCTGGSLTAGTVTVGAGADVSCEITNSYAPPPAPRGTLTLIKHVRNGGGGIADPDEWTLTATGPQTVTGAGNSAQVTDIVVPAGDYHLDESGGPDHYTAGRWRCAGANLTGSTVTVAADGDAICTITNTYAPVNPATARLTLVKHVTNTGGGQAVPAQWLLTAAGPMTVSGPGNSPETTGVLASAGDYELSESAGPADYTAGAWTCTGAAVSGDVVSILANTIVRCEITNSYSARPPGAGGTITLVKRVDNSGGGTAAASDWTLRADGPQRVSGPADSGSVSAVVVATGRYDLSESGGPAGYTAGTWHCTGAPVADGTLTLERNANAVCSITNTFDSTSPSGSQSGSPSGTATTRGNGHPHSPGSLANTGEPAAGNLLLGIGLIVAGAVFLLAAEGRRRRRH